MTLTRLAALGAPLVVAAIALALGVWRLMPGVGYWDTAEFQTVPPILGTAHPTGYPTYVILGWLGSLLLSPFGEPAYRMNLLSAVFVAIAAGVTVDLVRRLVGSLALGVVAGLGLAATPVAWRIATHADPHSLHLALVAILFWFLVRWEAARRVEPQRADRWLVAGAVVTGLSTGNHSLTLLLGLPILVYVKAVEPDIFGRRNLVVRCIAAFLVSLGLVYLELPIRGGAIPWLRADLVYGQPATLGGFVYVVTGEQFRGALEDPFGDLPGKLVDLMAFGIDQLGPLALLLPIAFAVTVARLPAYALLTGSTLAITCFFNSAYVNADIERYYLGPVLIAWTWLAVLAAAVADTIASLAFEPPQVAASEARAPGELLASPFRLAATALAAVMLIGPTIAALPDRAAAVDHTGDRSAQLWLDAVLPALEPDAIVVSWWSYSTPLWYAQRVEGRRPDVFVADDRTRLDLNLGEVTDVIDSNLAVGRPVYVIRVDTQELLQLGRRYTLTSLPTPMGANVFRVTARAAAHAP